SRSRGSAATTTLPTNGTSPRVVSHGKLFMSQPHEDDGHDEDDGPGEHGQGVRAGEPGLQAAAARGQATEDGGQPVDRTVDDAVVEPHKEPRTDLPRPPEHA